MYQLNKSNNTVYSHSINVSILARIFGKWLHYSSEKVKELGVKQCVLFHHEQYDGMGFPMKPVWGQVHDYAKIIAIVDRFDILTPKRPYGYDLHPFKAIRELDENAYTIYDPAYLYIP